MTKYQDSFLNMTHATCKVLDAYQSVWSANTGFSDAANALINASTREVFPLIGQQTTKSQGLTASKQEARASIAADLGYVASRIALYARTAGNARLRTEAHLTPTRINTATDDALVGMVTRITRLATEHLPALAPFGITGDDVSALSAKGDAYAPLIGAPRRLRQTVTEATTEIAALIKDMRANLETMDDYMVMWIKTAPAFHSEYFTCRRIVKPGFRTRALEVAVQSADGLPLAGAVFSIPAARIKKKTSERGVCRVSHLPQGTHHAQVSAEGFAPKELTLQIVGKEGLKLKVVLEAV